MDGVVFSAPEMFPYRQEPEKYICLGDSPVASLVIISRDYYSKNPEPAKRMLAALKVACRYLFQNRISLNNLVGATGKIPMDIIPSWSAENYNYQYADSVEKVNISISPELMGRWGELVQYVSDVKLIEKPFNLLEVTDTVLQETAQKKLTPEAGDLSGIKLTP